MVPPAPAPPRASPPNGPATPPNRPRTPEASIWTADPAHVLQSGLNARHRLRGGAEIGSRHGRSAADHGSTGDRRGGKDRFQMRHVPSMGSRSISDTTATNRREFLRCGKAPAPVKTYGNPDQACRRSTPTWLNPDLAQPDLARSEAVSASAFQDDFEPAGPRRYEKACPPRPESRPSPTGRSLCSIPDLTPAGWQAYSASQNTLILEHCCRRVTQINDQMR